MSWNRCLCLLGLLLFLTEVIKGSENEYLNMHQRVKRGSGDMFRRSTTSPTTTVDPTQPRSLYPGLVISPTENCTDTYIWWADGSIDCSYLVTVSGFDGWGVHKTPEYWCNEYIASLNYCCATCAALRSAGIINPTRSGSTRLPHQLHTTQGPVTPTSRSGGRGRGRRGRNRN